MSRDFKANPECGPIIAFRYENAGLRIVPVPKGGKNPRIGGFGAQNPTFTTIAPDFNDDDRVAILLGPCPAGLEAADEPALELMCLDLDGKFDAVALEAALGALPPTLTSKGGRHLYYWIADDAGWRERVKQWVKLVMVDGGALDVKWRGGYAIENGDWDTPFDVSLIEYLPPSALQKIVELGEAKGTSAAPAPRRSEVVTALAKVWPRGAEQGGTGGRYEAALALGGILGRTDWSEEEIETLSSQLFDLAECDDRAEQVLASVRNVRDGGNAYGWPKLKEHMVGTKQAIGRACNSLAKLAGLDAKARAPASGQPAEGDFIVHDPDAFVDREIRLRALEEILARRADVFQRAQGLVKVQPVSRLPGDGEPLGWIQLSLQNARASLSDGPERFWVRKVGEKGDSWVQVDPPADETCGVLDRKDWPMIRPLKSIAHCPFVRPDGTVCTEAGYDHLTGWYLEPKFELPEPLPPQPTRADAERALAALVLPWAEFPWETPTHALLPLSLVLSGLARAAVVDVPCHALDASTPGTGKSLALDLAGLVLSGGILPKSTLPSTEEELEKYLGCVALQGEQLLAFDNVAPTRRLGGEALERALTCGGKVSLRVLGKSEKPNLPWHTIVCATGNNLGLSSDMTRRTLMGRLIAPIERPEERSGFALTDVRAWVRQHRPSLVYAALVILRAHAVAGRPVCAPAVGGFEEWSNVVADALQWASGADVRDLRAKSDADPHVEQVSSLFAAMARFEHLGPMSAKALLNVAYDGHSPECMALREALGDLIVTKGAAGAKPTALQVGRLLGKHRDQIRDGQRLCRLMAHNHEACWAMRPV